MKIFGREPSLVLAALSGLLAFVVTFGLDWLTAEQAAWIVAVLNAVLGIVNALKVRPVPPTVWTYAVTSLAGLLAAYGLDFSQEQVGALNLAVLAVMAALLRQSVSPKDEPVPTMPGDDTGDRVVQPDSREWN